MLWYVVVFMVFANDFDRHMYIFQWGFPKVDECIVFAKKNKNTLFYMAHQAYDFKRMPLNLMCVSSEGIRKLEPQRLDDIHI